MVVSALSQKLGIYNENGEVKRVLFIAYIFPPHGGGGVQRTTKFLKYLPQYGWQGTVLTGDEKPRQVERSLFDDIPSNTRVERVRGFVLPRRPSRVSRFLATWVFTVDAQLGWLPAAVRRGTEILQSDDYSLIYSTSAPYTDHLVAYRLKQKFGLPWVADFRDPWILNMHAHFPTHLHKKICINLEKQVISNADQVLVVSEPMRQQFIRQYPHVSPSHFVTITNGYDREDYENTTKHELAPDKFQLVYTGSLYASQSIRTVLAAIHHLVEDGLLRADNFCFWIVGSYGSEAPQLVEEWNLQDIVQLISYTPHSQIIGYQIAADALVLVIGDGPRTEIMLTGKLFEYLAAEKPILAAIPQSAAKDLLQEANISTIAASKDTAAIAKILSDMFQQWRQGHLRIRPNHSLIEQYSRHNLTGKLADLFEELT